MNELLFNCYHLVYKGGGYLAPAYIPYSLCADLEEDIEHNRHAEGNAGYADDEPGGYFLYSEDIPEQIRCGIRHTRLLKEVAGGRDKHPKAHDASHAIERAQMLPCRSESAQRCDVDGISSRFGIELLPQSSNIFRFVINNWDHTAEKEKVTRLYGFDVCAERRGGVWKLNAKLVQPALCAVRLRAFAGYHRPTCAPPSTCSTSPVT